MLLRRNARSFSSRAAEYADAVAQEISKETGRRFETQRGQAEQFFGPASWILLILLPMLGFAGFACFCTSFAPNNSGWETWVLRFMWIPAAIGYVLLQFLSWHYGRKLVNLTDAADASRPPYDSFSGK